MQAWLAPGRVKSRNRKLTSNIRKEKPASIPRFETITDAPVLAQAAEYYNACIYPDLVPINDLGPNRGIYRISPMHLQRGAAHPDYLRLGIVCMTLSHRMNRTRNYPRSHPLAVTFFRYRGLVIRSLSVDIDEGHRRMGDVVIAGIITLLLIDAQQGASPHWRYHIEGLQKLITLRGGIRSLARSTGLAPLLHCFLFVLVIGDTSSPASDLATATLPREEIEFILEKFGGEIFAFQMCPKPLFAEVIKINDLRVRASKKESAGLEDLAEGAYGILSRIHIFSSEQWSESKPSSKEEWMTVGNVYRAAVALYCVLSLQSLSVLPLTSLLRASCTTHGQLLQVLLSGALLSPKIKRFLLWPLVVLGVEAVNGGPVMRAFVREQLPEMSRHIGSYVPLTAKGVLEKFWASGETSWDACFDRPYTLATQIAVDLSQLT
ncbi:uncharacterized protein CDV56_107698 [Aspergillus thermomutatus]|uniref:Uncharacterized protein n=1 Tax=Aspergillus thermomutatus TaxID=41047 RepID=A0A397HVR7_ASPTH|nr:uncharacterized protein CDV56_107698 [Aspergillus thermomutatus]RHZ67331.1 hypothetical protein CDV56_107698 [Aspergillus thermomutatus]